LAIQRFPLRINVGFFHNLPVGSYRDIHFEFPEVFLPPDLNLKYFSGKVHISRTPQGLFFEGNFKATAPTECVRCLEPFELELETEFEEVYAYNSGSFTDSGLYVPEDGNIDLGPVVREYMMVETPIKPICKPDCQGLCIVCGENLNFSTCEHQARILLDES
jgi:uncharacterized protein